MDLFLVINFGLCYHDILVLSTRFHKSVCKDNNGLIEVCLGLFLFVYLFVCCCCLLQHTIDSHPDHHIFAEVLQVYGYHISFNSSKSRSCQNDKKMVVSCIILHYYTTTRQLIMKNMCIVEGFAIDSKLGKSGYESIVSSILDDH